jgi:hypothetical protein
MLLEARRFMDSKASIAVLALAVASVALAACVTPASSLPGTALGSYAVVGTLATNTCGSGVSASNPWDFNANLSKDDTTLYLENEDGSDEVSGSVDSTDGTTATLIAAVTANADGTAADPGPCNLTLSTTYDLVLDAESPPKTFTGTASYSYSVATAVSSTTNCTDQLSSSGGKYATLPCTVEYSLKATRN